MNTTLLFLLLILLLILNLCVTIFLYEIKINLKNLRFYVALIIAFPLLICSCTFFFIKEVIKRFLVKQKG